MASRSYGITDFQDIAIGAAVLASGGGGSYADAMRIVDELRASGWSGEVPVADYDGTTPACVLALMGSPDAAQGLSLRTIELSVANTLEALRRSTGTVPGCAIPVEIGPINSLVPLIACLRPGGPVAWVVDGDGAGRAVPELPQTTFAGAPRLPAAPAVLADDALAGSQSARLDAPGSARVEALAGGILNAFGSYAGIALWLSDARNDFALRGAYLPGTLEQTRALGRYLRAAPIPPSADEVAACITRLSGRQARAVLQRVYVTGVRQTTTGASLDTGLIELSEHPRPAAGAPRHTVYNLNENLILYSSASSAPGAVAPDSICYYSEATGRGFSNATDDLSPYYDFAAACSTGVPISVIHVAAAEALTDTPGVCESFAALLRDLGYAGALPRGC
ncbi:DUF917 family protein [Thiomonas sp.]|uniref:S-methyl thiohydantoin desulfurase domain-containing protein n=1 Tax=Thiomonas sp. TaxID=2047785 RepID=UPI00262352FC|nr:DUF917 family protein [Thiomonas sp.]